jgi:hypothetical protein
VSEEEWVYISEESDRRAALGKESVVCLHGKPLKQARVERGIARVLKKGPNSVTKRAPKRLKRNRISLRTPPASPAAGGGERGAFCGTPLVPNVALGGILDPLIEQARPSSAFLSDIQEAFDEQFLESGFTQDPLIGEQSTDWPGSCDLIPRQASSASDDVDMFYFDRSSATIGMWHYVQGRE